MTFKIQLTEDQSEKVVAIMREKSQYRHISVESVEFTTDQTIRLRTSWSLKKFEPEVSTTKISCFRVRGIEELIQMSQYGTTYIYPNDQIYSKLQLWFQPLLREHRLEEIGL
jgi:hypothetical protein